MLDLLHLIPKGDHFSIGVLNTTAQDTHNTFEDSIDTAIVYDLLMTEEGAVYGLQYSQTFAVAFTFPHDHLSAFVDSLYSPPCNLINIPQLLWLPVSLNWYPPNHN